jgi:hypothetical protein
VPPGTHLRKGSARLRDGAAQRCAENVPYILICCMYRASAKRSTAAPAVEPKPDEEEGSSSEVRLCVFDCSRTRIVGVI